MSYVASDPESYADQSVGNGQCVAFVCESAGAPPTSQWKAGIKVRGNNTPTGTAIATFDENGHYPSAATGNHAAIYINQSDEGLQVWDQWRNPHETHKVSKRTIHFRGGQGSPSNDGDAYSVIE